MKIKLNNIYNTFRCNSFVKEESMNDILKGTKSVLSSKNGFKNYIRNYSQCTKRIAFKDPQKTDYPILKKESIYLIPIKRIKNKKSEDFIIRSTKKKKQIKIFSNIIQNEHSVYLEKYKKRYNQLLRLRTETNNIRILKQKTHEKRFQRYNSLFLDFFDKWNDYNITSKHSFSLKKQKALSEIFSTDNDSYDKEIKTNKISFDTNFNIKERYFGLNYDENEIFNNNYDKFMMNRINDIKLNKIKNFVINLESSFDDSIEKKIQLKLESIKINFFQLTKNNNENIENNNYFFIYLPLSYAFLFYYKDIDFFQKVLLSVLYFKKDFKSIDFKDDELYNLLNSLSEKEKKEIKKEENEVNFLANYKLPKKSVIYEHNSFLKGIFKQNNADKDMRKTYSRNINQFKGKFLIHKQSQNQKNKEKKIKIIYNNSYNNFKTNYIDEESKNNIASKNVKDEKKKNNYYNEYYFFWETPEISYKVKIEMPKIFFLYEDIGHNIVTFCEKNLFLYLYKKNFINWDFYILNYFFSIKDFRAILVKFFSFSKDYSLIKSTTNNKKLIKNIKSISILKKKENLYNLIQNNNDRVKTLFLINKKIYNQINENYESYNFFYSDSKSKNYILKFHSYIINIEYKKLNPYFKWEFILNFKQMRYLNKISKYVNLNSFLPKIITTDFEYGILDINFGLLDDKFDVKILRKENNDIDIINANNEINIEIKKPYVEIEKIYKDKDKLVKQEFNYIFLQSLNKLKMEGWSKKILESLKDDLILYKITNNESNSKINFFKSKFSFIDENRNDNSNFMANIKRNSKQKLTYIKRKNIKNYEQILKTLKSNKTNV